MKDRRRMHRRYYQKRLKHRKHKLRKTVFAVLILLFALLIGLLVKVVLFPKEDGKEKNRHEDNTSADLTGDDQKEQKSTAVITLNGENSIEIKLGEEYIDPGYSAADKDGTDLTAQLQVDSSALNRAGEQQIIYSVKDSK